MLLSSPKSRYLKTVVPAIVFIGVTVVTLITLKDEFASEPIGSSVVVALAIGCAAWVLWRPLRLKVADSVEERQGMLQVRRGSLEVAVPYSDIQAHEYLRIGSSSGVKLRFRNPTALGSEIGFYIDANIDPTAVPNIDPMEHMERQLEKSRHGRAV